MRYWTVRSYISELQHTILPAVLAAISLLLVRVIHPRAASFALDTSTDMGQILVFNMFDGNVAVYVILAMLPQIGVVVLYSVWGCAAQRRHAEARLEDDGDVAISIWFFSDMLIGILETKQYKMRLIYTHSLHILCDDVSSHGSLATSHLTTHLYC